MTTLLVDEQQSKSNFKSNDGSNRLAQTALPTDKHFTPYNYVGIEEQDGGRLNLCEGYKQPSAQRKRSRWDYLGRTSKREALSSFVAGHGLSKNYGERPTIFRRSACLASPTTPRANGSARCVATPPRRAEASRNFPPLARGCQTERCRNAGCGAQAARKREADTRWSFFAVREVGWWITRRVMG